MDIVKVGPTAHSCSYFLIHSDMRDAPNDFKWNPEGG